MSDPATTTGQPSRGTAASEVGLAATRITESYQLGMWPRRRDLVVMSGPDLLVDAGEVVVDHEDARRTDSRSGPERVPRSEPTRET